MSTITDLLNDPGCFVIGHRGAAGLAPENTLPSFQEALNWRCPMIELDVHLSGASKNQQELVIIHDRKLSRTTSGKGLVSNHSVTELRALDAGGGAQIPLLTEIFALLYRHAEICGQVVALNIELKGAKTGTEVAQFLDNLRDWPVLVSSFDHEELDRFRQLDPHTPVAPLFDKYQKDWLKTAQSLNAAGINLGIKIATPQRVQEMTEAGFPVSVYTVNDPAVALQLQASGVKGIFTDRPDLLMPALTN